MATLTAESFGSSNNAADYSYMIFHAGKYGRGTAAIAANGPFGDPYLTIAGISSDDGNGVELPLAAAVAAGCVGYRVKGLDGTNQLLLRDPAGNTQLSLAVASNGAVTVTRGDGTALWAGGTLLAASWRYVEFGFLIDAANGSFAIQVDGAPFAALSGINTKGSPASGTVSSVSWMGRQSFTHIYVNDVAGPAPNNGFLGDARVVFVRPSAPGDAAQFAPTGAAANWQAAASDPPAPASVHNDSGTVGALDLFHTSGVPAAMGTIYGVQLKTQASSKADGGNRAMANVIKSGGVQASGAANAVTAIPSYMRDIVALDPATGAAWTRAGIGAAQVGYTVVA